MARMWTASGAAWWPAIVTTLVVGCSDTPDPGAAEHRRQADAGFRPGCTGSAGNELALWFESPAADECGEGCHERRDLDCHVESTSEDGANQLKITLACGSDDAPDRSDTYRIVIELPAGERPRLASGDEVRLEIESWYSFEGGGGLGLSLSSDRGLELLGFHERVFGIRCPPQEPTAFARQWASLADAEMVELECEHSGRFGYRLGGANGPLVALTREVADVPGNELRFAAAGDTLCAGDWQARFMAWARP